MKTTILAVVAAAVGLQALFRSRTLSQLLSISSRKYLKYPHSL